MNKKNCFLQFPNNVFLKKDRSLQNVIIVIINCCPHYACGIVMNYVDRYFPDIRIKK